MSSAPHVWSAAHIALLERLWRDGVTALQISKHLGTTRNAVIGKLQRLKLLKIERQNLTPGQRYSAHANLYKGGKPRPIKLPALPKTLAGNSVQFCPILSTPTKPIPIQELTARSCRWIEGDPRHVTVVLYCGAETVIGSSWCPSHYRRVYPRSMALEAAA